MKILANSAMEANKKGKVVFHTNRSKITNNETKVENYISNSSKINPSDSVQHATDREPEECIYAVVNKDHKKTKYQEHKQAKTEVDKKDHKPEALEQEYETPYLYRSLDSGVQGLSSVTTSPRIRRRSSFQD